MASLKPIISDSDYNQILGAIGYPVIDNDTFSFLMDKDAILDTVIEPALEMYYSYHPFRFPIKLASTGANSMLSIPTIQEGQTVNPDIPTLPKEFLGIMRAQFVTSTSSSPNANNPLEQGYFYGNPFFTASQVLSSGSSYGGGYGSGGGYGTPYPLGFENDIYQRRFYLKSIESSNKVYWFKYDPQTKTLYAKSSISGMFYWEIATYNNDVSTIQMGMQKQSFIKYCKGALKLRLAEILGLTESDLPVSIDRDILIDSGDKMMEEALNYWQETASIAIMR
jgi:hypothetical protein